jgi:hypothetical protein
MGLRLFLAGRCGMGAKVHKLAKVGKVSQRDDVDDSALQTPGVNKLSVCERVGVCKTCTRNAIY